MTDHTAPELKPCPFCGGSKVHYYPLHQLATHRWHPFVRCHDCSAGVNGNEGDCSPDAASAIAAWNTRTEVDALVTAAYEDAAALVDKAWPSRNKLKAAINYQTPADARAALRAHTEAAVRLALEAAINAVSGCDRVSEVQPAIRTLDPAQFIGGTND